MIFLLLLSRSGGDSFDCCLVVWWFDIVFVEGMFTDSMTILYGQVYECVGVDQEY